MDSKVSLDIDALRKFRRTQGLSQEGLAYACEQRQLRVSIATIKRAESGKKVSVRTASELAKFFDVDIECLVAQGRNLDNKVKEPPTTEYEKSPYMWTILWVRVESIEVIPDVMELLQRRGSVWQEQLGNTILATFGNYGIAGKGHIHAQMVLLDIRKILTQDVESPVHFYAALQLGTVSQQLGHTELSPQTLQWFARYSVHIPVDGIVVSDDLYSISHINFSYIPHNVEEISLWLLQGAVCLERALPLVGRSSELLQVNAVLDDSGINNNPPAIVHITGQAGIGKSRFLSAVHEQAQLRQIMVADIDLETGWDDPVKILTVDLCRRVYERAKTTWSDSQLMSMLFRGGCDISEQFMVADLLGIVPLQTKEFEQWKKSNVPDVSERLEAIISFISCLLGSQIHSLLISIDNVHLGGSTGYDVLSKLLSCSRSLPITCVVTSRLESNSCIELESMSREDYCLSTIELGPLSLKDSEVLCTALDEHDENYRRQCVQLAEGVPLYLIQLLTNHAKNVEEMPSSLTLLVEQKLLHLDTRDRHVVELLSVSNSPLPIASIADILGGERFSPESLVLAQLVKVDNNLGVRLSHQLVRQIIYKKLPDKIRNSLHAALADYAENKPFDKHWINEISLARHFEHTGHALKAANYMNMASKELLQNGFYDKALELLQRALELLGDNTTLERDNLEIDIQLALSSIYKVKYGWVSPLLKSSYQRVEALCGKTRSDKRLVMALFGLWTIELATLNLTNAEGVAQRCLSLAKKLNDKQGCMCAYTAIANTLFWRGKHRQAEFAASQALSLYHVDYTASSIQLLGQDPRALAGCFGAWSASLLGEKEKAEEYRHAMIAEIEELQHEFSLAIALQGSVWLDYHYRRPEETLRGAEKLEYLSEKMSFPFYRGVAALFLGWAKHKLQIEPHAAEHVFHGYHQWLASSGDKLAYSLYCTILGEIYVDLGNYDEARRLLEKGIDFATEHNEHCYLPEMYRLLALCFSDSRRNIYLKKGLTYTAESPLFEERLKSIVL